MVPLFFKHPAEWWHGLAAEERLAVLAVAIGACTVTVAAWMGVRRWWQRWKQEGSGEP
jgi:hypothetical protein